MDPSWDMFNAPRNPFSPAAAATPAWSSAVMPQFSKRAASSSDWESLEVSGIPWEFPMGIAQKISSLVGG